MTRHVHFNLASGSYAITIDPGLLDRLGGLVREAATADRLLLAVDDRIASTHGRAAQASLQQAGFQVHVHPLHASEHDKSLDQARAMYQAMLAAKMTRSSPVVALGGGIVGDLAGFVAATFMRGVPLLHVPTTLLAMVDASIGGKTGVNFPLPDNDQGREALGKNLIGAFWQPRAVFIDPLTLRTLEARQFRCGLAECIKHALVADADLLSFIETNLNLAMRLDETALVELIHRSVAIKAGIVQQDPHERGRRMVLNLGHTFGHAIEALAGAQIHHGEAVAIGIIAALRVARQMSLITADDEARVQNLINAAGLPTQLPRQLPINHLMEAMGFDKKSLGSAGSMRLILPQGIGCAIVRDDVPITLIELAWQHVGASDGTAASC